MEKGRGNDLPCFSGIGKKPPLPLPDIALTQKRERKIYRSVINGAGGVQGHAKQKDKRGQRINNPSQETWGENGISNAHHKTKKVNWADPQRITRFPQCKMQRQTVGKGRDGKLTTGKGRIQIQRKAIKKNEGTYNLLLNKK